MTVFHTLDEAHIAQEHTIATSCALGMFDGVHRGHQTVIGHAVQQARLHAVTPAVFTFANHPQTLLAPHSPIALLSLPEERLRLIQNLGVDCVVAPPFDTTIQQLGARDFIETILIKALRVKHVTVGYDFRFGCDRQGNGAYLQRAGAHYGFSVHVVPPVHVPTQVGDEVLNEVVSSTLIRKLLHYGDAAQAADLLGRPYALNAPVVSGVQRGRALGFPTANVAPLPTQLVPGVGTYMGMATLKGKSYQALCNIGVSPTFNDASKTQPVKRIEIHLLDYDGPEFYDQYVSFAFLEKLRDEQAFESAEALVSQITQDCRIARQRLTTV